VRATKHESWRVRAGALVALGRGGGARSLPALTLGLADPDRSVRQAAALALGERFERARADSLATPAPELRAAPAKLLAVLGDASAGVRLAAARSLGRAGPLATADLARAIAGSGDSFRAALLIDALGAGGDPRAVAVLKAMPSTSLNAFFASHVDVALARLGWVEARGGLPVDSRAEAAARVRAAQLLENDSRTRAAVFRGPSGSVPVP
jgi:HEAT repeat protein